MQRKVFICFKYTLEGMAHYSGQLQAPAEGFGVWPRLFFYQFFLVFEFFFIKKSPQIKKRRKKLNKIQKNLNDFKDPLKKLKFHNSERNKSQIKGLKSAGMHK